MSGYYFLSSLLPELDTLDSSIVDFDYLNSVLLLNLEAGDYKKWIILKRFFDLENFALLWNNKKISYSFGEINQENVEKLLSEGMWSNSDCFEDFFLDFLNFYQTDKTRFENYSNLVKSFLSYYKNYGNFFSRYFGLKQDLRIILAGYRAKLLHMDISYVLRDEDAQDPIVYQVLMQKDTKVFDPPIEYMDLKPLFDEMKNNPVSLRKALAYYERSKLEDMFEGEYFSSSLVLGRSVGYLLKYKYDLSDSQAGRAQIEKITGT